MNVSMNRLNSLSPCNIFGYVGTRQLPIDGGLDLKRGSSLRSGVLLDVERTVPLRGRAAPPRPTWRASTCDVELNFAGVTGAARAVSREPPLVMNERDYCGVMSRILIGMLPAPPRSSY